MDASNALNLDRLHTTDHIGERHQAKNPFSYASGLAFHLYRRHDGAEGAKNVTQTRQ